MKPITRTLGFYLVILIALAQLANGVRGLIDPGAFALYFGVPATVDLAWVQVYALRALLLGALAALLLWREEIGALRWLALIALALPIGDFLLAHNAGAGNSVLLRHAAIGLVLLATFLSLQRWLRHNSPTMRPNI